jgi:hypothetical protein
MAAGFPGDPSVSTSVLAVYVSTISKGRATLPVGADFSVAVIE